jgi:hypothetical protein
MSDKIGGQVILEFTFAIIAIVLLIVGMTRIVTWSGRDLVERRDKMDAVLIQPVGTDVGDPLKQTRHIFYTNVTIGAAVNSSVFGDENP